MLNMLALTILREIVIGADVDMFEKSAVVVEEYFCMIEMLELAVWRSF